MRNDTPQMPQPPADGAVEKDSADMTEVPSAVDVGTAGDGPTWTRSTKGKTRKGASVPAASRRANGATNNSKLTHLVIDSGAIIKGAGMTLVSAAENFWTVPEVLSEIRDKKARHNLQVLPFELKFREPSDEAVRFATGFARQTGDLRSLSRVDLRIIALTYMLERQETGGSHLRTAPVRRGTSVNSKNKGVSTTAHEPPQKSRPPNDITKPFDQGAGRVDASSRKTSLGGKPVEGGPEAKAEKDVGADVESLCEGVKTTWTKEVIRDEQGGDHGARGRIAEEDVMDATCGGGDGRGSGGGGDDRVGGGSTGAGQDDGLRLDEEKEDEEVELEEDEEEQEEGGGGDDRVGVELSTGAGLDGSRLAEEEKEDEEVELEEGEENLEDGRSVADGKHEVEAGGAGIDYHEDVDDVDECDDGGDDDSNDDEDGDEDGEVGYDVDGDGDNDWEPEEENGAREGASKTSQEATSEGDTVFAAGDFPVLGMGQDGSTTSAPLPTPAHSASPSAEDERSWSLLARSNPAPFKVPPKHDPTPLPAAAPIEHHAHASLGNSAKVVEGRASSSGHKRPDGAKAGTSRILSSSAAFGVSSGGVGDEDDDGKGWVTPSNIKSHKAAGLGLFGPSQFQRKEPVASSSQCRAGCVTTDFAMQNVILQVGLPLLSLDGMAVRGVKQWILRCAACFKTCTEMGRLFCPVCGNASLDRVSCSLNARTGATHLHLKKNHKVNLRGSKYSIPAPNPEKGRFEGDLLLREDQLLTGIWAQKAKRKEKDVSSMFGKDITGDVGMTISRSADIVVGYGRKNPNAARGRERRGKKGAKNRP